LATLPFLLAKLEGSPSLLWAQGTPTLPLPVIAVEAAIRSRYGDLVNYFPIQGLKEFILQYLLVGVNSNSKSFASVFFLQATLVGVAVDFRLQLISDWVYKFVVTSRNVTFHIYNLKSYTCEQYKIFNLWGNGGAHWDLE
jgi:hypothetical protein